MKAFLLNNFLITTFIYDLLSNFFFAQNSTLNQIFNAKLLIESKGETVYRITNEKRHLQFYFQILPIHLLTLHLLIQMLKLKYQRKSIRKY